MPCDYPLSEPEKQQGYVLMCANTAASSELTIETLEAAGPSDIVPQQIVTTTRAVRELAPNTRLLHLQTPRSHRLAFPGGPVGHPRASRQRRDTRRRRAHDAADRQLPLRRSEPAVLRRARRATTPSPACSSTARIKAGDTINLWGPSGEFVLRDGQRPLVFAACDTGFAPIRSLIEHALSLDCAPSLSLFWLATRSDGHFQANQCRAWSEALDPFEYALFTDSDAAAGARQIADAVRADQFDVDCDFYLAGPGRFVTALREALLDAGVPAQQIAGELV